MGSGAGMEPSTTNKEGSIAEIGKTTKCTEKARFTMQMGESLTRVSGAMIRSKAREFFITSGLHVSIPLTITAASISQRTTGSTIRDPFTRTTNGDREFFCSAMDSVTRAASDMT